MHTLSEKQTKYLSQAIQLEEAFNPVIVRATMIIMSCAVFAFIVWSGLTNINEVAHAAGEIVPQGHSQVVQHLEGGIVSKIIVHEGEMVHTGQELLALSESELSADLQRAKNKQTILAMQEERLRAYLDNRQPNFSRWQNEHTDLIGDQEKFFDTMQKARLDDRKVIGEQITQKKQMIGSLRSDLNTAQNNYAIAKDVYDRRSKLNRQGYASDMQLLDAKQRLNIVGGEINQLHNQIAAAQAEIQEFQNRLSALGTNQRDQISEKLDVIMADSAQNAELIDKLQSRFARLVIKAPVDGIVKGLSVNTVGAVVQPGQTVMEIVPMNEKLVAQVKIMPQHIGHVKVGQNVQLKFSSFDFSRYGSMSGQLEQVSATTFSGENGERYYQGKVVLNSDHVGHNVSNKVMPGMTVMADIITGEKTILDYLLKPIHVALKTSFTER